MREVKQDPSQVGPVMMRTDKAPFSDIRVRQAMMMATDFQTINKGLYNGEAQLVSWPYYYTKAYADLYLGLDDPECPASVKELYTYNPDQAKELLKEAGYPNGFKASLIMLSTQTDYYSIIKDQWSKVGISLTFDVRDAGVKNNIMDARSYDSLITGNVPPPASWPEAAAYSGTTQSNLSMVNDPTCNDAIAKWNALALTDENTAMALTKELMKYVLPGLGNTKSSLPCLCSLVALDKELRWGDICRLVTSMLATVRMG